MSRALCIPAALILFCALVLSFLTSISLPYLTGLDIARANLTSADVNGTVGISEIRVSFSLYLKLVDFYSPVPVWYLVRTLAISFGMVSIEGTNRIQGTMFLRRAR